MKRDSSLIRLYRKSHHKCEICNSVDDLHIHHIIPLADGGEDCIDNMMMLCSTCHRKMHIEDTSRLIRNGMSKREPKAPMIDFFELQKRIFLEDPETASEVVEIINGMRLYYMGRHRTRDEAYRDVMNEIADEVLQ